MATDQLNTPQAPDREDSPAINNVGSIDPGPQYPHNSRLDYYSFIDLEPAGYPADLFEGQTVKDERRMEEAEKYRCFFNRFFRIARILENNPNWITLINHYPIEGLDKVLPQSRYYSPYVSNTEYIALAAFIYGIRYDIDNSEFSRLNYVISLSAFVLTQQINGFVDYEYNDSDNDSVDYSTGKTLLHLVLIIVEYFRMREEYSYHFHPSRIAKEGKDEAFFKNKRDKEFKENPEVKDLWDDCVAVVGEPREVSLSERLHRSVFDPFYRNLFEGYRWLLPIIKKSPFGSWQKILITPITQIVERLFVEDKKELPYQQLYRALTRGAFSYDGDLTDNRIIGFLNNFNKRSIIKELHLIIIFFHMCTVDDKRRHIIKYNMQDSTKSHIKDLEEICEAILKRKNDSTIIFKDIERFDSIHKFVKLLKTEYYLSHLDEEIVPDLASFSAFDQPSEIFIAPDFNDLPKDDEYFFENIIPAKGVYRCPFEIIEPAYLEYSSCLGDFEDEFYMSNAAVDGDRRSLGIRFSELVNWFVQNGVIRNEPAVADLFAYRLTGMGEKPEELPKIEIPIKIDASVKESFWTLIYLAKTLYNSNTTRSKDRLGRGIYPKLADFFVVTDPEHPEKAEKIQQDFDDIVNSRIVDGKQKNPSALVKGKVPDSLIRLIINNFGLPQRADSGRK